MATKITAEQTLEFANALGLDPRRVREGGGRFVWAEVENYFKRHPATSREFADADPSEILKLNPMPAPRTATTTPTTAADALIDGAIGAGKIDRSERDEWRRRYDEHPDLTRDVLDSLRSDPARAERAYAEDSRLRDLGDAFDDYMGIPEADRVREYADDGDDVRDPTGLMDFSR